VRLWLGFLRYLGFFGCDEICELGFLQNWGLLWLWWNLLVRVFVDWGFFMIVMNLWVRGFAYLGFLNWLFTNQSICILRFW